MTFKYMSRAAGKPRDARRVIINRNGYGKNWSRQRKAALIRDNYTCQRCGYVGKRKANGRWDVSCHHRRKIAWFVKDGVCDYEAANHLDNLVTLCEVNGCHKSADGHQALSGFEMLK